jgi:hypothetical protein
MPKSKLKTLSEAEAARRRAITGLTNLGREDEADRISRLSTKEYAEEKGFEIVGSNPWDRRGIMAAKRMTRAELEDRVSELEEQLDEVEEERDDLQEKVDSIAELVGEEEQEEDETEEEDEDEQD